MEDRIALSVTIDIDYSHDTSGFFTSNPQAKTVLQEAATMLGSQLNDSLAAIVPGGGNTWTATTFDPGDPNNQLQIDDLTVPANTIIVYVGGANLANGDLGLGGTGGFSATGFGDWPDVVDARGQTGALATPATDYGPWGGSISFDTTTAWSFAGTGGSPAANQFDFLTVALHELGHVLGVGTTASWFTNVDTSNNTFIGPHAEGAYGGPVPLDTGRADDVPNGHWASGTMSNGQDAVMDPIITVGTRRLFTPLDWAGLDDIGWQTDSLKVTAEPQANVLAGAGFGLTVAAVDPDGHVDSTFNGVITLSLGQNPSGANLGGTLEAPAKNGVAVFSPLSVDRDGSGYTINASTPGLASTVSTTVNVTSSGVATQLAISTPPPASVTAETGFGFTVKVLDAGMAPVSNYTGNVMVSIASGPNGAILGGTLSAPVKNGIATFSGLTLTQAGTYTFLATTPGLTSAQTGAVTIASAAVGQGPPPPPPPPPTIVGEQILTSGRGKKAKLVGFLLRFSTALSAGNAQNGANYVVVASVKKGRKLIAQPVPVRVVYSPAVDTVSLLLSTKQTFAKGGRITVIATAPFGVESAGGTFLAGASAGIAGTNAIFTISPNARTISP
jgi:hypothetical protein